MGEVTRVTSPCLSSFLLNRSYSTSNAIGIVLTVITSHICFSQIISKRSAAFKPDAFATLQRALTLGGDGIGASAAPLRFYVTFKVLTVCTFDVLKMLVKDKALAWFLGHLCDMASPRWPRDPGKFLFFPMLMTPSVHYPSTIIGPIMCTLRGACTITFGPSEQAGIMCSCLLCCLRPGASSMQSILHGGSIV